MLLSSSTLVQNSGSQSIVQIVSGGAEVFIVDKDVHLRNLLAEFLGDLDCCLTFFDDGYTALDAIRRNPPKLVITEILVPKLDGLTLCRLIKGDSSLASVKVLVLTFLSAEERARLSRADGFIHKPIQRPSILESVRALIGGPLGKNQS
jgi:DNA-binding response OmpR family regulator